LTGEVRRVNKIDVRVKEAAKVGFKRIFIPRHNYRAALKDDGIEIVPVASIPQALKLLFG
jgi:DNA repair protein RadA/Sms